MSTREDIKSYSSETRWSSLWREALCLYQNHRKRAASRVTRYLDDLRRQEVMIESRYGLKFRDMDVLDVGPGPFLVHMCYFAQRNRVTGIDLNVIPSGFAPRQYIEMWRKNGLLRMLKTIARKSIGIDRQYQFELAKQLGQAITLDHRVLQMDARNIRMPSCEFDLVYSRSVFHHIPDPGKALAEVARVLRPRGIAILSFHLFTSETGSLDPRVYTDSSQERLRWAHLRPSLRRNIQSNAYVNGLRLEVWRKEIEEVMRGAEVILHANKRKGAVEEARALCESGELADFTLEELVTDEVVVIWRKQ